MTESLQRPTRGRDLAQDQPPRIVIVGAGVVGLSHAVAALDAGYRVTVIEQDAHPVLASIRNFGHIGSTVHAGAVGELARESRPIWESIATRAGLEVRRSGTLVVARGDAEDGVLREYAAGSAERMAAIAELSAIDTEPLAGSPEHMATATEPMAAASSRASRLLTGEEAGEMLQTCAALSSGLFLPDDLTADPRSTVARLVRWVSAHERGEVKLSTSVQRVETGAVHTSDGQVHADHIIVAAGHLVGRLFPDLAAAGAVRECALQMMRVRAPHDMRIGPAVLTGTSMLRYSAFDGPAADALRIELQAERPELFDIDANVMLTQQADGTLLVGDSHATHDTAPPFLDERWSQVLLDDTARLLGTDRLEVLERWQGVYATSSAQEILQANPLPGVTAITVTTGVGMTIGPALGARTIAALQVAVPV